MFIKSIRSSEREASIGEVLFIYLSEFGGWRVTLSNSIQEGVELCMATRPDLILLDTSISETDAPIFIEQLKQQTLDFLHKSPKSWLSEVKSLVLSNSEGLH